MRRIGIIIIVAILLIGLGVSYGYNSFSAPNVLGSPDSIAVDSKGRFYMLGNDSDNFNVIRINKSNIIDYHYSVGINKGDSMLRFGKIFSDGNAGRLYSIKDIMDNKSNSYVSSSIIYFNTDLKHSTPQVLYEKIFDSANPPENHHIKYIYPNENYLYFTTVSENLKSVAFYRLDIGGLSPNANRPELLLSFNAPGNSTVNTTLCTKNFILVQTMDSKIYHMDLNGSQKLLFPTQGYTGRYFPLNLCLDSTGLLHFNEIYSHDTIAMDVNTGGIVSVIKGNEPLYEGSSYLQSDISDLSVLNDDIRAVLIDADSGSLHSLPAVLDNGEQRIFASPVLSSEILIYNTMKTALLTVAVPILIFGILVLFRFILSRKPTLLVKLITFVLPIILLSMFLFSRVATYIFYNSMSAERTVLVKSVGSFVAQNIDTGLLSQMNTPRDMTTPAYNKLLKSISKVSDFSEFVTASQYENRLYCILMKVEGNKLYTAVSADMPCFVPLDSLYSRESIKLYSSALSSRRLATGTIQDTLGIWTVSILPVFDSEGKIIGMLETGINSKDLESLMFDLSKSMLLSGIAVSFAVLLAFFISLRILLRPLALLKEAVISVYNGNYGAVAPIKANDEVADIGRVFNKLSVELDCQFKKLTSLNEAYYKLVPPDTFKLLKKDSILEISLGDQVSIKMTLMNVSIRNFENATSDLSPEVTFKFINNIFEIVSSNTGSHLGTIHSYNVDKITALFRNCPEDALQSVINIRAELIAKQDLALSQNAVKTDAGFYIHTSDCIYGIVGDENRYSPAVVTERNDLIYSLDSLQQDLMCSILVTQSAYAGISSPSKYSHRYIGYITDTSTLAQIDLYEFFDGDEPQVLSGKKQTLEIFKAAMDAYMSRDFYKARNLFAKILKVNSQDTVSRWFMFKSDMLCKQADELTLELAIAKY
ncbi:HAMP domain-containing protein [Anaerobacterium chartisolvens]|uniref:HAMP domain-containing protein n=1 Tax=Anaerobacterium chartisolvens TaxID=1297424 RepID=A0A369AQJ9_9FIRM|nr:adenylate/guanylate cyclase domain-containing protein [Anaerobacterium chartisolvens]RCX11385.1 HAMP domain-containing protein [Anaerobacterium chartisolvens]